MLGTADFAVLVTHLTHHSGLVQEMMDDYPLAMVSYDAGLDFVRTILHPLAGGQETIDQQLETGDSSPAGGRRSGTDHKDGAWWSR